MALEERAAQAAAEQEAHHVARRGRQPHEPDQRSELHLAARGDDAADHDRGLAGHHEAHEGAGLEEGERRDRRVGPGAERARGAERALT